MTNKKISELDDGGTVQAGDEFAVNRAGDSFRVELGTMAAEAAADYYSSSEVDTLLGSYLTTASAASTYLTSASAASTYLTQANAASTYLTQANAASNYQPLDADLTAFAALSSTAGLIAKTAANTYAQRTLTGPSEGITVSNGNGASGNPTLALANDLGAIEALASTGFAARTTTDTWAQRTITGTANQIAVTNGDGVSGNPTLALTGHALTAATSGYLFLGGYAQTVNLNSVADTPITITVPAGMTNYRVGIMQVVNNGSAASLTTAQFGLFTSTGGGGVAIINSGTALTAITATGLNTAANSFAYGPTANYATNAATLYLRITQAQGAAATASFYIFIYPVP